MVSRILAGVLVWAASAAAAADALTLAPMSFGDLARGSQTVVYARVVEVEGRWTADRRAIESLVTVAVIETLKGSQRARQQFLAPGGEAGGRVSVMPGAPAFREGDLIVVFLASAGPSIPHLVGLTQGVLRVTSDPRTGVATVAAPLPDAPGSRLVRGTASRAPITIEALTSSLREVEAAR